MGSSKDTKLYWVVARGLWSSVCHVPGNIDDF